MCTVKNHIPYITEQENMNCISHIVRNMATDW